MVVKDYLPLSFVEGDVFFNLMNIIVPEYKVPTRNTIKSRIGKLYEEQKMRLISEISSAQCVTHNRYLDIRGYRELYHCH